MKQKIKVGVDFDGVLAYNPLRIFRAPVVLAKKILKINHGNKFYVPKNKLEQFLFWVPHELSFFPAFGLPLLRQLVQEGKIDAYIVSGRYGYLRPSMDRWLKRHQVDQIFTSIHTNIADEQPHVFKERKVNELGLDYFIEDNLDIVEHLTPRVKTKVIWIYNILDRNHPYSAKYPYLKKAIETIIGEKA